MSYIVTTAVNQPDQLAITDPLTEKEWPQFMLHDTVANSHWAKLYTNFPEYQFTFTDPINSEIIAIANSIPFFYDASLNDFPQAGWDYILQKSIPK